MGNLLEKVLEAHGGLAKWNTYNEITVKLVFGGLAFAAKFNRKGGRERLIKVAVQTPMVIIEDYPSPGKQGVFTPDLVWIETTNGKRLKERAGPRNAFKKFRHKLWWDNLDLLYFVGYASWNYFNSPFLLAEKGVETREMGDWRENGELWERLEVIFPDNIPTHCKKQIFYFDKEFRMRRFDYDPEVFASWAKAAHYCDDFKLFSGILIPTKRRVVPRMTSGKSKPRPLLVWIDVKEVTLG